ncbi:MAG TPA: hypothetical protein VJ521_00125, partial [Acidobacteriota bacterium]|nr:hypothetical protein [Acidobacteriota bacterium]
MSEHLGFTLYSSPEAIPGLVHLLSSHERIFIDTEVADWATQNPRLSLIQISTGDGRSHIIDVLARGMKETIDNVFIPAIMQNPDIEKWAHNASFERRFLGGQNANSLQCTLKLSRSIPYHRLPLRSLSLANLVDHFFQNKLDKSFQKADWGVRPLLNEQLQYAGWDPEWCRRVYEKVTSLALTFDPSHESPEEIDAAYRQMLAKLKDVKNRLGALRNTLRDYMLSNSLGFFSDFSLHTRLSKMIQVRSLISMAQTKDPSRMLDFTMLLSQRLLAQLLPGCFDGLQSKISITSVSYFVGPVAPHVKKVDRPTYSLNPDDPYQVAADYMLLDDRQRMLESEKLELRQRMRAWMDLQSLKAWGSWKIAEPQPRWHIDVRDLEPYVPS